ncbi:MAG: Do family serine endopeptidase [bacterium]
MVSGSKVTQSKKTAVVEAAAAISPKAIPISAIEKENLALRRTPVVIAAEKVGPAVVNISTEKIVERRFSPFGGLNDDFFKGFFDQFPTESYKQQTLGSGVIINSKGYILTNEHVILRASKVKVTLPDEREAEARVIGADPKFDLAILKIDMDTPLPAAQTGDSDNVMIGETVIAIGNPFGLKHTVTTGVVSAVGRSIKTREGQVFNDFIQTDASINPGNSGGPLVNIVGEVIGINTAIYAEGQGIGFAIPINRAMRAVAELLRSGKIEKTWTGIRAQEMTAKLAQNLGVKNGGGVLISDVIENSPAAKAGLKTGDVIVKVDNVTIDSIETFVDKIGSYMVGESMAVEYLRDGAGKKAQMKLSGLPLDRAEKLSHDLFGLDVEAVSRAAQLRYRLQDTKGVMVTAALKNGPAAKIGLQPGDVIRQLGIRQIDGMDDFKEAVTVASVQESVFLVVQRGIYLYHVKM